MGGRRQKTLTPAFSFDLAAEQMKPHEKSRQPLWNAAGRATSILSVQATVPGHVPARRPHRIGA